MKKLLLPLLLLTSYVSFGQLWTETFDEAAGSTTGTGSPSGAWTSTCVSCNSGFLGEKFEVNVLGLGNFSAGRSSFGTGIGTEGVWTSPIIAITGYADVGIYLETSSLNTEAGDYLRVYYRLNTGSGLGGETLFHTATNGSVTTTGISPSLNGTEIQIVIRAFTTSGFDYFSFDNIGVTNTLFSAVATGDWNATSSWSTLGVDQAACGCSPSIFTNVVIGGGDVITITAAAAAASVTINGTADALGAGTLDFSGNFVLDIDQAGTVTVNSGGSINGNGNAGAAMTFLDDVSHSIVNNGTISIGDITVTNSSLFSQTNVTLTGSGTFTVTDAVAINENSVQAAIFTNSATVSMTSTGAGALSGDGNWVQGVSSTLNYAGSTITLSTFDAANTGNTVNYNRGDIQTIEPATYHHLTMSNSGAKSAGGNLSVGGNYTRSGSATFTNGGNTVTLNGSSAQTISAVGGEAFAGLTINNTFGTSPQITLSNPVSVSSALTMTAGIIQSSATNLLIMLNAATTTIGSTATYVNGPIQYNMAVNATTRTLNFPIGKAGTYGGISLRVRHNAATSYSYTAEVVASSAAALGYTLAGTTDRVSGIRYWDIKRGLTASPLVTSNNNLVTTGAANAPRLTINYVADDQVNQPATLTVVKNIGGGSTWNDIGAAASGFPAGSVTTTAPSANFTSFSLFTLANLTGGTNPLPIELLYFNAKLDNDKVLLDWATASEKDNDFFTIERAINIEEFETIGDPIDGKGTTNEKSNYTTQDETPVYGRSYYRLKQTDFDGKFSYSDLQVINYGGPRFSSLQVYPNPSHGNALTIVVTGLKEQPTVPVQIYNVQGQKVFDRVLDVNTPGTLRYDAEFGTPLRQGLYIVKAGETLQLTRKIIVD